MFTDDAGTNFNLLKTVANGGLAVGHETLIAAAVGSTALTKGLVAAAGITLGSNGTDITITNASPASGITLADGGAAPGHATVVATASANPAFLTKGIAAGTGITVTENATDITITNSDLGSSSVTPTDASTLPGALSLVDTGGGGGTGPALRTIGLFAGAGMALTPTGTTDITVTNASPASGITLADGGAAPGHATVVATASANPAFLTKGIAAGTGIAVTENATDITIATTTTVANAGVAPGFETLIATGSTNPAFLTKGLVAGTNVTLVSNGTDITINTTDPIPWTFIDQNATGVEGGDFTSGAWQTRTLQTSTGQAGANVTLAANVITLLAGTYHIRASAPGYSVDEHQARFQNTAAGTTALWGTSEDSNNGRESTQTRSFVEGNVTVAGATTFELQHQCSSNGNNDGFGRSNGFAPGTPEIYATISIWKVA